MSNAQHWSDAKNRFREICRFGQSRLSFYLVEIVPGRCDGQILDLLIKGVSPGIKDPIVDLHKEEEIVRSALVRMDMRRDDEAHSSSLDLTRAPRI